MEQPYIPTGYQRFMPYLILPDADQFFSFTEKLFGATQKMRHLHPDGQLMHGEVAIDGMTIMFGQATDTFSAQPGGFYIHVVDADAAYEAALALGCTRIMEPSDQSYGRSSGVKDPFGNTWWLTATAAPAE